MRVLLISANTEQLQMPVLPVGLAGVAASTEKAGHDVRLLNLMTRENSPELLERSIRDCRPEIIGISVRNIDNQCMQSPRFLLNPVRTIVDLCRNLSPAVIVLGGAGYSMYPQSSLAWLGADMGIEGEGERAFPLLLERLSNGRDIAGVPGLVLPNRRYGRETIKKLDEFSLPSPGGPLSFPTEFANQKIWLPIQARRGCCLECSYCSTATIEGKTMRKRSPESVVESIVSFVEAGFANFFFVDNTFNFPASYAEAICDKIIESKLDIRWRCILYPWKIDESLVDKLARAGCVEVSFGFESGSRDILQSMNKRFQPEDVRTISRLLDKYDIGRMGFLLLGGPGETKDTVLESLEFADSLELESMKVTLGVRIYPYTALARVALAEGVILPGTDLLFPAFYLAKGLDGWVEDTISVWLSKRPHWHF